MKPDREERLWEVARYVEVLLRCDVSSLQFDRVYAILDDDYTLTVADMVDAIGRANIPEEYDEIEVAVQRLGDRGFDHTPAPVPAGHLIATLFELIDPVSYQVDEEETTIRVAQALVTSDRASILDVTIDSCVLVKLAAGLNPKSGDIFFAEMPGMDEYKALDRQFGLLSGPWYDDEALQEWFATKLSSTQCTCQSDSKELRLFFEQLGLKLLPGLLASGTERAVGALAWTNRPDLKSLSDIDDDRDRNPEQPTPDGVSITFRRTPDGNDRIELLYDYGPILGRLELAMPNYRGVSDGFEPGENPTPAACFLVDDLVTDVWDEAVETIYGAWLHIPENDVLGEVPRIRNLAWTCEIRITASGEVILHRNQVDFRAPSGDVGSVEADDLQGSWVALRDFIPGWRDY